MSRKRCTLTSSRWASKVAKGWTGEGGGGGGGGVDVVWRGCSSSGPRTPITPVLSLPLRPHPDTGHRPVAEHKHEERGYKVIWEWLYYIIIVYWSSRQTGNTVQYNLSVTYCQILGATSWKEEGRFFWKLSWLFILICCNFGEVVKFCKRLAANCISSHLNCSVPFIFLTPNTACHCRHKHLLRGASC